MIPTTSLSPCPAWPKEIHFTFLTALVGSRTPWHQWVHPRGEMRQQQLEADVRLKRGCEVTRDGNLRWLTIPKKRPPQGEGQERYWWWCYLSVYKSSLWSRCVDSISIDRKGANHKTIHVFMKMNVLMPIRALRLHIAQTPKKEEKHKVFLGKLAGKAILSWIVDLVFVLKKKVNRDPKQPIWVYKLCRCHMIKKINQLPNYSSPFWGELGFPY